MLTKGRTPRPSQVLCTAAVCASLQPGQDLTTSRTYLVRNWPCILDEPSVRSECGKASSYLHVDTINVVNTRKCTHLAGLVAIGFTKAHPSPQLCQLQHMWDGYPESVGQVLPSYGQLVNSWPERMTMDFVPLVQGISSASVGTRRKSDAHIKVDSWKPMQSTLLWTTSLPSAHAHCESFQYHFGCTFFGLFSSNTRVQSLLWGPVAKTKAAPLVGVNTIQTCVNAMIECRRINTKAFCTEMRATQFFSTDLSNWWQRHTCGWTVLLWLLWHLHVIKAGLVAIASWFRFSWRTALWMTNLLQKVVNLNQRSILHIFGF